MAEGRYVLATISRLLSARLLYRVCVGISVIFISNYLIADPALLDIFDVASAATSIMMIVSEVGMSMVVMRSGSQHGHGQLQKYYGTALFIESCAWITLFLGTLGIYAAANGLTTMFWLIAILGIGQAVIQYRVVFRSIYRALHHNEWITYIEVVDGISKIIGVYLITRYITDVTTGAYWIAGMFSVTTIVFVAIYGLNTFKQVSPKFEAALISPLLKEGVWFSLQALVMTVYFEIDKLMLRLFQITGWTDIADGDIGRYTAAARIVVFLLIFHRVGLQVITPYLYKYFNGEMEKYKRVVGISTRYLSATGIALGIGIVLVADQIFYLVYDPKLWSAIPALQIFGVFILIRFFGITSSQILATSNQQPLRTKIEIASVVLNVILNCILIPIYGFIGCAYATLATEIITQGVFYVISRRKIGESLLPTLYQILPALAAGFAMGIVVWLIKGHLHVVLTSLVGMATFTVLLYAFGFIKKSDLKLLRNAN